MKNIYDQKKTSSLNISDNGYSKAKKTESSSFHIAHIAPVFKTHFFEEPIPGSLQTDAGAQIRKMNTQPYDKLRIQSIA